MKPPKKTSLRRASRPSNMAKVSLASAVLAGALFSNTTLAVSSTWSGNVSAVWSATGNWSGGIVADGAGSTADFSQTNITAARTITIDGAVASRTVGTFLIGDAASTFYGYTIAASGGGTLTFNNNGDTAYLTQATNSGANTFSVPIVLADNLQVDNNSGSTLTMSGGITGAKSLILNANSAGAITVSGTVNNAGTITNSGAGSATTTISAILGSNVTGVVQNSASSNLVLSGSSSSFTGGVTVLSGTVTAQSYSVAMGTGTVTLGDTGGSADAALLLNSYTYANPILVRSGGSGVVALGNAGNAAAILSGSVTLNKTLSVAVSGTGSVTLSGIVSGTGALALSAVNPGGILYLSGANTFSGGITLNSGILKTNSATGFGTGTITINGGALDANSDTTLSTNNAQVWNNSFYFEGTKSLNMGTGAVTLAQPITVTVLGNTLTIGGTITGGNGIFDVTKAGVGTLVYSPDIALTADQTAAVLGGTTTLSGVISGGYGITATGGGVLRISGANNTYTGVTRVTGGAVLSGSTLKAGGANSFLGASSADASNLVIDNGTLSYSGGSTDRLFTIGVGGATLINTGASSAWSNTGALAFTGAGARTLTLGTTSNGTTLAFSINDAAPGEATSIVVNDAGAGSSRSWILSGNSAFTGGLSIVSGRVSLSGTITGSDVTINSGGEMRIYNVSSVNGGKVNVYGSGVLSVSLEAATQSTLQNLLGSTSNGVISLAMNGMSTTQALDMALLGSGYMFLGGGSSDINGGTSANTQTYAAATLGVGAQDTYRLNGGNTASTGTLIVSNAVLAESGSGTRLIVGQAGTGGGGIVNLQGDNALAGTTSLNAGTLILSGSFGALSHSDITAAAGTTLTFDSSTAGVTGTTRAKSVTLNGATFNITGNGAGAAATNSIDTISGALSLASGNSTVTLTGTSTKNWQLRADSFSRSTGATVLFRGNNLGVNTASSATANNANILFTNGVTLSGTGVAGTSTVGIIAGAYGDTSGSGTGFGATGGLVTYDAANGVRLLNTSTEYTSAIASGQTQLDNVRYVKVTGSGVTTTNLSAGTTTVNSLSFSLTGSGTNTGVTISGDAGSVLKINSGVVYGYQGTTTPATTDAITLSVPTLDFNNQEAIFAVYTSGISNNVTKAPLIVSGAITNANGLTKSGPGQLTLSGATANTYSGTTVVNSGILVLNKTNGINAIPGDLIVNGGGVEYATSNQIADTANITINSGWFTLQYSNSGSSNSDTFASLTMNGGSYGTGSGGHGGLSTITGDATIAGGSITEVNQSKITVNGTTTFSGGTILVSRAYSSTTYDTVFTVNNLNLVNTSSGTYNPITINSGAWDTGNTIANLGGQLLLKGDLTFTGNSTNANTLLISGGGASAGAIAGTIALDGVRNFNIGDGAADADLQIDAMLADNGATVGGINKNGAGTLLLSGSNTYTGATNVNAGALKVDGYLGSSSAVTVAANATLSGSGTIGGSTTVNGGTVKGSGMKLAGATTFASGTGTLAGTTTATGGITVASTAALNVSGTTTGNVTVSGALNGSGRIVGTVGGAGLVSPGNSPGILTVDSLAVGDGLDFAFELRTSAPNYSIATASDNDLIHITGLSAFSGALTAANEINVYFSSTGATYLGGFFVDNLTAAQLLGAVEHATFNFYLADASGTFQFNNQTYSVLSASNVSISAQDITGATFGTGTVNGSELEFVVVPEPSTWAMMAGGIGLLIGMQRCRRGSMKKQP